MTDGPPKQLSDAIVSSAEERLITTAFDEYSPPERLLIGASSVIKIVKALFLSNTTADDHTSQDRAIRKFFLRSIIERIAAALILILTATYMVALLSALPDGADDLKSLIKSATDLYKSIYIYFSQNLFQDASTYTTLSIGVIAGSISIATLNRAEISSATTSKSPYFDLISGFSRFFNGTFVALYMAQIAIWLSGFFWINETCYAETRINALGQRYYYAEQCGSPAPIIFLDSLIVLTVCLTIQSLTVSSRARTEEGIYKNHLELLDLAAKIESTPVKRRKFPMLMVSALYVSITLLGGLAFSLILTLGPESMDTEQWLRTMVALGVTASFLALVHFTGLPFVMSEFDPRALRLLNWGIISILCASFSISITSVNIHQYNTARPIIHFAVWLAVYMLPFAISSFPFAKERKQQRELNSQLRMLNAKQKFIGKQEIQTKLLRP